MFAIVPILRAYSTRSGRQELTANDNSVAWRRSAVKVLAINIHVLRPARSARLRRRHRTHDVDSRPQSAQRQAP